MPAVLQVHARDVEPPAVRRLPVARQALPGGHAVVLRPEGQERGAAVAQAAVEALDRLWEGGALQARRDELAPEAAHFALEGAQRLGRDADAAQARRLVGELRVR